MTAMRATRTRSFWPLACVPLAWALLSSASHAGEALKAVQLTDQVAQWEIDPTSGRLFATQPKRGRVVEVAWETGKVMRQWDAGPRVWDLLRKRDRLIAVTRSKQQGDKLTIISLSTNRVEGQLTLPGLLIWNVACSQKKNSQIYALCSRYIHWRQAAASM